MDAMIRIAPLAAEFMYIESAAVGSSSELEE
jgi:hypothetical protein